jgi:hypothetical protein
MFRLTVLSLSVCAVVLAACAPSTLEPVSVPLTYRMMAEGADLATVDACAAIGRVVVTDARAGEPALGKRFLQENPSMERSVTASGSVEEWIGSGADQVLRRATVATGREGAPELRISVEEIVVEESVFRRAEYDGRIVVTAALVPAGGSTPCWTQRVDGSAQNYGYAGSPLNYQETLNHALDRALFRLVRMPEFSRYACGECR